MWMKSKRFQLLGGGALERFGLRLWSRLQFIALGSRKGPDIMAILRRIHRQRRSLLSAFEQYLVYAAARAQTKLPGAMAEVGVYAGASAKLICEAKGDKALHLFDTFSGLPESTPEDRAKFEQVCEAWRALGNHPWPEALEGAKTTQDSAVIPSGKVGRLYGHAGAGIIHSLKLSLRTDDPKPLR